MDNPAYEFGVTIGQAFNLAYESMDDPKKSDVLKIFQRLLGAKLDPEFRESFRMYLEKHEAISSGKVHPEEPTIEIGKN